jgi:hypothetical protein
MPRLSTREAIATLALGLQCILVAVLASAGHLGLALSALGLLVATVGMLQLHARMTAVRLSNRSRAQLRDLTKSVKALSEELDGHRSDVSNLRAEIRGVRVAQQMTAQTSGATHESVQQAVHHFTEHLARIERPGGQDE